MNLPLGCNLLPHFLLVLQLRKPKEFPTIFKISSPPNLNKIIKIVLLIFYLTQTLIRNPTKLYYTFGKLTCNSKIIQ